MYEPNWREVYERTFPKLFRALVAMGARPDEAEDALHDGYLRALHSARPIERPEGWLFVVALRSWRARRLRDRIFRPLDGLFRSTPPPSSERVDLIAHLAKLPRRQREVFIARYVLGLSQEETAAALRIARGTVASTTSQVTAVLRQQLGIDP
jgi:DNA-directed RNA polymerase specialized sigma24 family protein